MSERPIHLTNETEGEAICGVKIEKNEVFITTKDASIASCPACLWEAYRQREERRVS